MYQANENRYNLMDFKKSGESGLKLPMVSLGFWHNFGDISNFDNMKKMCFTAFDNGITHFDLANNYYAIACENNYADGCYNLAFSYFDGSGVESDLETGMILLEKACTLGNEKACDTFKESL